jgi:hypothetical protein
MEFSTPSSFTSDVFVTENNANHNLICFFVQRKKKRIKLWLALFFEQKKKLEVARNRTRACREKCIMTIPNFNQYSRCNTDHITIRRFGDLIERLAIRAIRRFMPPRDSRDSRFDQPWPGPIDQPRPVRATLAPPAGMGLAWAWRPTVN